MKKVQYVIPRIREVILLFEDQTMRSLESTLTVFVEREHKIRRLQAKDVCAGDILLPSEEEK